MTSSGNRPKLKRKNWKGKLRFWQKRLQRSSRLFLTFQRASVTLRAVMTTIRVKRAQTKCCLRFLKKRKRWSLMNNFWEKCTSKSNKTCWSKRSILNPSTGRSTCSLRLGKGWPKWNDRKIQKTSGSSSLGRTPTGEWASQFKTRWMKSPPSSPLRALSELS